MQHFPKLAKDPTRRGPNCDGWVFQGIGDGRDAYHVANGSVHKQAAWQSPYLVQILKVGFINKVFQVAHGCAEQLCCRGKRKFLFLWSGTHCVCGLWVGRIYMPSIMLYLRIPATVCSDLRATLWFQRHPFFCETKGMGYELAEMLTLKSASDFQSFLGKSKILKRAPGKWQPPQFSNLNSGV